MVSLKNCVQMMMRKSLILCCAAKAKKESIEKTDKEK